MRHLLIYFLHKMRLFHEKSENGQHKHHMQLKAVHCESVVITLNYSFCYQRDTHLF